MALNGDGGVAERLRGNGYESELGVPVDGSEPCSPRVEDPAKSLRWVTVGD